MRAATTDPGDHPEVDAVGGVDRNLPRVGHRPVGTVAAADAAFAGGAQVAVDLCLAGVGERGVEAGAVAAVPAETDDVEAVGGATGMDLEVDRRPGPHRHGGGVADAAVVAGPGDLPAAPGMTVQRVFFGDGADVADRCRRPIGGHRHEVDVLVDVGGDDQAFGGFVGDQEQVTGDQSFAVGQGVDRRTGRDHDIR